MISLIGIFVITSSACFQTFGDCNGNQISFSSLDSGKKYITKFIRVSSSSVTTHEEIARPVCEWIDHKWIEILRKVDNGIVTYLDFKREIQQCIYCDKKRIKKEVWEDVK